MKALIVALLCLPMFASAGDFTIMGGASFFRPPDTGTYWNNNNDKYVNNMTPPAFALRYDTDQKNTLSFGAQYTNFGSVTMDAMAVSGDYPTFGGYIAATGSCFGPCGPLYRWQMKSETQSIAFIAAKHWGKFSLEGGINIYEVKTSGTVYGPNPTYRYPDTTCVYAMPMIGAAYQHNARLSIHAQVWAMPCPGDVPPAFTSDAMSTLMAAYTWK